MIRLRIFLFLSTFVVVGTIGYFLSFYAKGYRFDFKTFKFLPNGILVIKSNPDGAQILVNGELKTATNATISLGPNNYDITVKKEGYRDWTKRLSIQKEVVTEADAHLFRIVPSLSAVTFSGVENPVASPDFTKIAYIVPQVTPGDDQGGLWLMEIVNLPLGFSRAPRRITDGNLTGAKFTWSADGRQILLETKEGAYELDSNSFTPQGARVNKLALKETILTEWSVEEQKRSTAKISSLSAPLADLLTRKASAVVFSPDESKILYTASGQATLAPGIISSVPGASTQKEQRNIEAGHTYVYDLKEDRNFEIDADGDTLSIEIWKNSDKKRRMFWFASSRHLVLAEDSKVTIMDLDGSNRQLVYSGIYLAPNALPAPNIDRLLILTNLGADSTAPNIYTLSLK